MNFVCGFLFPISKYIFKLCSLVLICAVISCNIEEMNLELKEHRELEGIPSASGIEITENGVYIVGDNSPWLFKLDKNFQVVEKIKLFPDLNFSDSIIEKIHKPDLEALTKGNKDGSILLAFGSGSKSPERDIVVEIDLITKINKEFSLIDFYSHLELWPV